MDNTNKSTFNAGQLLAMFTFVLRQMANGVSPLVAVPKPEKCGAVESKRANNQAPRVNSDVLSRPSPALSRRLLQHPSPKSLGRSTQGRINA